MDEVKNIYDRIFEMNSGDWKGVNIGETRLKNELREKYFVDLDSYGKYNFMLKLKAKAN